MIKRPLNPRFSSAVLAGQKTTTIRDNPWPVGVPIMLYNWSGAPYRSKQIDVAPVIVKGFWAIRITHREDGGMIYAYGRVNERPLHETEGFATRAELDAWFRPLVKPGQTVVKAIMLFSRSSAIAERPAMKTENLPPRRCAVASGSVKHPPYKVREIKNIFSGKLIGWSIYPDQIPAMRKTIKRVLASMVFTGDKTAHKEMANAVLMSIGLPNVADQQCRTKEPR